MHTADQLESFQRWSSTMLATVESVLRPLGAVYCSAPITSGLRFIDWVKREGLSYSHVDEANPSQKERHAEEVIRANVLHASAVAGRLRTVLTDPVINPAAIPNTPGWTQLQWLDFWDAVITKFAHTVVFLDGWQ